MACEGNDERIGEALIKDVIEEELKDIPSEDVPPLTPLAVEVKTEQEQKIVNQLSKMIRIIGDRVQGDKEFQDAIDGVAQSSSSKWDRFKEVASKVFEHGITWERIAVLFYVAGRLAVRQMVEAHLPQSVTDILRWTVDFFRNNLLGWIREHGGWINSFSELAVASMQSMSSMSSRMSGLVIIFIAGLGLGSFITWRLTR
ncbi:apoptosis regulator BAX-like isoform X3 [Lates calcarifer]|uniref:Apoptosis regulator BAX-like isoform X3 n=1 Tax=Lates calcarifer TaxID=8187 RepID=A0AAJ7LAI1_LATCA|nr:apoptosis regulator BAX-like isoform X3 [Lates calcarifer]